MFCPWWICNIMIIPKEQVLLMFSFHSFIDMLWQQFEYILTGDDMFIPDELVGKGGYAKVYRISTFDYLNEQPQVTMALKVSCLC